MYEIFDVLDQDDLSAVKCTLASHISRLSGLGHFNLEDFHSVADVRAHALLARKRSRVLSERDAQAILSLPSLREFLGGYPDYNVSNVVFDSISEEQRPEVYFRVVRPGEAGDVGTPHCDFWFDAVFGRNVIPGQTIKLWFPLTIEHNHSGLLFFPACPPDTPFVAYSKDGFLVPKIASSLETLGPPELVSPNPGQVVRFRSNVMHAGAINTGSKTRVSMEITLVPTLDPGQQASGVYL